MNEFEIIRRYFDWQEKSNSVMVGIGDDASICTLEDENLVSSIDTLNVGVHFKKDANASDIAHKALAVNLSDLAAMGATPKWFSLALSMPRVDKNWLKEFSKSLRTVAKKYDIHLIGGDTTYGALSISIHMLGVLKTGEGLLRSRAQISDKIFISNTLGDAALALKMLEKDELPDKNLLRALNYPTPQVELGKALLHIAGAAIDISDGLIADLGHITLQSGVGAEIYTQKIPISKTMAHYIKKTNDWCPVLAGGDDYELCFTVEKERLANIRALGARFKLTEIGKITSGNSLKIIGTAVKNCKSYQHFA